MDSGCTVPTLNSGLRATSAVKLLTEASGRAGEGVGFWAVSILGAGKLSAGFMLRLKARFLAEDKAGKSIAAKTAITAMTTNSSIKVKAFGRFFIGSFWYFAQGLIPIPG